jgi:hypothetical protein
MITVITDTELVPDTGPISGKTQLFEMIQQGPITSTILIRNAGANQINYTFQEFNGTAYVDMGLVGTEFNTTLASGSTGIRLIKLISNFPKVRLIANATGGSTLEFTVTRYVTRGSFGDIPLLSF